MGLPRSGLPRSGLPRSGLPGSGLPRSGLPRPGLPGSGLPRSGLPRSGLLGGAFPGRARCELMCWIRSTKLGLCRSFVWIHRSQFHMCFSPHVSGHTFVWTYDDEVLNWSTPQCLQITNFSAETYFISIFIRYRISFNVRINEQKNDPRLSLTFWWRRRKVKKGTHSVRFIFSNPRANTTNVEVVESSSNIHAILWYIYSFKR